MAFLPIGTLLVCAAVMVDSFTFENPVNVTHVGNAT